MTVLSADINIEQKDLGLKWYPVVDNDILYKGALIAIDASGYAKPASDTSGETVVGIADEKVDNTVTGHTAGGLKIRVRSGRAFLMVTASATQASVGDAAYVTDDQTVAFSGTANAVLVGPCSEYVSATSVWINIPLGGQGTVQVATSSASLTTGEIIATGITSSDTVLGIAGLASTGATVAGGSVPIVGGVGGTTSGAGGLVSVTGGAGGTLGTGNGGAASLVGGASGTGATGAGGATTIQGGAAGSTNGAGGAANVTGGAGIGTGAGGAVTVLAGAGGLTGAGGNVAITAGAGGSTSGAAGTVIITAGSVAGTPNTVGGVAHLIAGAGKGTQAGGVAKILGGAGGGTSGAGGDAQVTGGAGSAGDANGGNVDLVPGAADGTGLDGELRVNGSAAGLIPVSMWYNAPPAVAIPMFVASRAYRVKRIEGRVLAQGSGGACTGAFWRAASATALGSGTALNTGSYNFVGTIDANQNLTLEAAANLEIAAGNVVGFVVTGTSTAAQGCLTITLAPV